jgi:hypothetical protein
MTFDTPSWICVSSAPIAWLEASVSRMNGSFGFGYDKTGVLTIACFNKSNALL